MTRIVFFFGAAATAALVQFAQGQPAQPMPTSSTPVAGLLADAPHRDISNGLITARLGTIDGTRGFYRGTRFDQAGQVFSLRLNGREFYGPWFDAAAPDVLDYAYDAAGQIVAGPDSAAVGPVEEFAPLNFAPTTGSHFVKIGVGILYQPDAAPYDHYRHYRILDAGQHTTRITPRSSTYTQTLEDGGLGYVYTKTLELVPGKSELLISHSLKNTGRTAIHTNVYDHNFLRLVPGNNGVRVSFNFPVMTDNPPPDNLLRITDRNLTFLRAMKPKERLSFLVTGFGATAQDYDFRVTDTTTGAGVHVVGDQPITRLNIFSIDKVQSVEPYVAIDLEPGQEKRWSYRYTFTAPKQ